MDANFKYRQGVLIGNWVEEQFSKESISKNDFSKPKKDPNIDTQQIGMQNLILSNDQYEDFLDNMQEQATWDDLKEELEKEPLIRMATPARSSVGKSSLNFSNLLLIFEE